MYERKIQFPNIYHIIYSLWTFHTNKPQGSSMLFVEVYVLFFAGIQTLLNIWAAAEWRHKVFRWSALQSVFFACLTGKYLCMWNAYIEHVFCVSGGSLFRNVPSRWKCLFWKTNEQKANWHIVRSVTFYRVLLRIKQVCRIAINCALWGGLVSKLFVNSSFSSWFNILIWRIRSHSWNKLYYFNTKFKFTFTDCF